VLNTDLRQLSRDEEIHLEKEFEDHDKRANRTSEFVTDTTGLVLRLLCTH